MSTFLSQARTLLLVGFITGLVWLMAEAESLRSEKLRPEVRFVVKPDGNRIIRVEAGQEFSGNVTVSVEGPTAAVDALATRIRTPIDLEPGMDGVPAEPGRHTVNLAEALRAYPLFRDSGVTINAVDPPSATVWGDDVVQRQATVRVEVPESAQLEAPPLPRPATITVRLPDSVAKAAGAEPIVATARLTPEQLANLPEGRRVAIGVPLTLPTAIQAEAIRVTPPSASVELTLRSRASSCVVQNVPVQIRIAPTEIGVWEVDLPADQRVLTDVTVTGPAEMIEQLRPAAATATPPTPTGAAASPPQSPKTRLVAYVTLSFEDLDRAATSGKPIEKEVTFCDVPSPLRFEPRPRTVQVSVHRSEGPPVPR
jgi:hypothetical protein